MLQNNNGTITIKFSILLQLHNLKTIKQIYLPIKQFKEHNYINTLTKYQ